MVIPLQQSYTASILYGCFWNIKKPPFIRKAVYNLQSYKIQKHYSLRRMSPLGLEPRTHGLKGRCSTIELEAHKSIYHIIRLGFKQKSYALASIGLSLRPAVSMHARGGHLLARAAPAPAKVERAATRRPASNGPAASRSRAGDDPDRSSSAHTRVALLDIGQPHGLLNPAVKIKFVANRRRGQNFRQFARQRGR